MSRGQAIGSCIKARAQQNQLLNNRHCLFNFIINPFGAGNPCGSGAGSISIKKNLDNPAAQAYLSQCAKALAPFMKEQMCELIVEQP